MLLVVLVVLKSLYWSEQVSQIDLGPRKVISPILDALEYFGFDIGKDRSREYFSFGSEVVRVYSCTDSNHLLGQVALIHSILINSKHPQQIHFFIAVDDALTALRLRRWTQKTFDETTNWKIFIKVIPSEWVADKLFSWNQRQDLVTSVSFSLLSISLLSIVFFQFFYIYYFYNPFFTMLIYFFF